MNNKGRIPNIDWLDPIKAFALLAILLNHFVEEFGKGPWFTNPGNNWPDFATRMANVFPSDHPFPISLIQFLGWLGDSGPGVFILASGFGLTWAVLHRPGEESRPLNFWVHPEFLTKSEKRNITLSGKCDIT
jgi:peptidoglycan/LPS O-acetylase OafA/YrhL